ncbi:MAG: hypothetical protein FXF47_03745 [Candidatus Mcinerneyibacterium aminivorans]|uniref:Uncharacterized protein n=1 Tax=Candidatus Mcinerneyibacterium aminivorans TaxID=2703815 RepID=A0A5D0MJQ9_9BACT|nr:MAG: hypothetical protein FXF47_03745 [Candidatus Mcinerneyibacterium aminivorans]
MKYLRNNAIFILLWFSFLFLFLIIGNIKLLPQLKFFFFNLIIIVIISVIFTWINENFTKKKKWYSIFIVIIFMTIDQIIKSFIFFKLYEKSFLKNIEIIDPVTNFRGSFIGELLQIDIKLYIYFIVYIISMFIIIEGYRFYSSIERKSFWSYWVFLSLVSGIFFSAFNKLIWGKSIDFIYFKPLFHSDFKDLILITGLYAFFVEIFDNKKNLQKILHWSFSNEIKLSKHFLKFVLKDIKKFFFYLKN